MYRLLCLILPLLLLITGCRQDETLTPALPDQQEEKENTITVNYLALGDSYTIGTGIGQQKNFPNQLRDSLEEEGIQVDSLRIIAQNGWTTQNLISGINAVNPDTSTFNLVTLLIGVNNQYRGFSIQSYNPDLQTLLQKAIAYAGGRSSRVFMLSIPDYSVTPFGQSLPDPMQTAQEIDDYNALGQQIASDYGITFIDVNPISKQALNNADLIAPDGLHPSGAMYSLWVQALLPEVRKVLE